MFPFITQDRLNLIKKFPLSLIFLLGAFLFSGCDDARSRLEALEQARLVLPSGKELNVFIARGARDQASGLSGVKPEEFKNNEAMIFPSDRNETRQFWMPNTHFDLDIVFLTKDLYVLDVHRRLKHFPHSGPKEKIPLSKAVYSRHVLEIKSSSPLAQDITPGTRLRWSEDVRL